MRDVMLMTFKAGADTALNNAYMDDRQCRYR